MVVFLASACVKANSLRRITVHSKKSIPFCPLIRHYLHSFSEVLVMVTGRRTLFSVDCHVSLL
ncbi:hypothetical protein [Pseudomonas phage PEV2]|uniref:Uncharacterized protein n=1 Tax=Pseudomonas phage PEV2 TaxID=1837850 RepID=A0A191ZBL8_9CAUD|nr:hypothetical protein BI066_gp55 [Pseudomonas phage PEV2]ANJ63769.1 hypothetical protein [Pseudomonas phage PEV2]